MPNGAEERKLVREAFVADIPGSPEHQWSEEDRAEGWVSDGNNGVQWNAGTELVAATSVEISFGVNLEGKKYNERYPIYKLIKRELERPLVFEAIEEIDRPKDIEVHLLRDAYLRQGRPRYYRERVILETSLEKLNAESWRHALTQALNCYDSRGEPRHLPITFYYKDTGQRRATSAEPYEMKPHLHFRSVLWLTAPKTLDARIEAVRNLRNRMQPLYNLLEKQSA
jgi:hypothetical protein